MFLRALSVRSLLIAAALARLAIAQTVSVQQYGARGDGSTDDSTAIQTAINSAPAGSTVDFGSSSYTYLVGHTIYLLSNRNYSGSATVRLSGTAAGGSPVFSLRDPYPANVSITGLTLDGNNIGSAFWIDFANNTTALYASGILIQSVAAVNSVGQAAIFSPGTLDQSTITGNMFSNCTGGIAVFSPDHLVISNNHFDHILMDDAIMVTFNPVSFPYGESLRISNNNGENLGRMGIEVVGSGTTLPGAVVVNQNVFTNWLASAGNQFFGISIFVGTMAQISGNVVEGPGGVGIEIGSPGALVTDNLVTNFALGATVEAPNTTIQNNHFLYDSTEAISVTNSPYSKQSTVITGNYIAEAQSLGINIGTQNWQGSQINQNTIIRSTSWPDDGTNTFTGIGITPPSGAVSVTNNNIMLQVFNSSPVPGFIGIRVNGDAGSNAQSVYDSNTVRATGVSQGSGIYANSPGSLNGAIVTNNSFIGLAQATAGAPGQTPATGGNTQVQCLTIGPFSLF